MIRFVLALTLFAFSSTFAYAAEAWPDVVRIGIQKGDPLVALRASGELEKALAPHHVAVKWTEFVYGAPMVEAINAGEIDVGTVGATPPILAQAGAAPDVVYVAYAPKYQKSYAIVVPANSKIQKIADLKGKKVAFAKGSQGHLFALKALEDAHIDPSSVQFAYLSYSDARSAFERGFVDAWVVPDPRYADTELKTGARTILTIGDLSVPQYAFYIATRSFGAHHPQTLRLLFDVLEKETARELADLPRTAALLATNTGVPIEVWNRALPRLEWGVHYPIGADVIAAQQDAADLAYREHIIPKQVRVQDAIIQIQTP